MAISVTDREFKIITILKKYRKLGIKQYTLFKELKKVEGLCYETFNTLLFSLRFKELITIKKERCEITKRKSRIVCLIN